MGVGPGDQCTCQGQFPSLPFVSVRHHYHALAACTSAIAGQNLLRHNLALKA